MNDPWRPAVLSIGYTRSLWEGPGSEDHVRMSGYAELLEYYLVIVNSRRRHGLAPLRIHGRFEAVPTGARTVAGNFLRMVRIGSAALRSRHFDVIQAQDPLFTGPAAWWLAKRFRKPLNVCVYGPNVHDPHWLRAAWWHRWVAPLGRRITAGADGLQVDGRRTALSFSQAGIPAERIHLKPMVPANLKDFLGIPRTPGSGPGAVRLLSVGRLAPQKNLRLMLEAVATATKVSRVPLVLTLVGSGPEEPSLRQLTASLGLQSVVGFAGQKSRAEVLDCFAQADAFLLSSDYEGFPRVLMEAAAAGLPIVSTDVSGTDESVLPGKNGWVVPVGDTSGFAVALGKIAGAPEERVRMGLDGREMIRRRLDPGENAVRQVEIWRQLCQTGRWAKKAG